jgi:tRNA(Glu) U13 pseudouridine synthase TruD
MRTVILVNKDRVIIEPDMMLGLHLIIERLARYDYSYAVASYIFNTALSLREEAKPASAALERVFKTRRLTKTELHAALTAATIELFSYATHFPSLELDVTTAEMMLTRIESKVLSIAGHSSWEWVHASST